MKKYLPAIAGVLLGLVFVMASSMYFLGMYPKMTFPDGSPIKAFNDAFGTTGYMSFVKVFELTGGILVMLPRTRYFGLLLLGPVLVNIVAFHLFIAHGGFLEPLLDTALVCAFYLLWAGRKRFAALLG